MYPVFNIFLFIYIFSSSLYNFNITSWHDSSQEIKCDILKWKIFSEFSIRKAEGRGNKGKWFVIKIKWKFFDDMTSRLKNCYRFKEISFKIDFIEKVNKHPKIRVNLFIFSKKHIYHVKSFLFENNFP